MPVVLLPMLAAMAGAWSFTSPCCLPLMPDHHGRAGEAADEGLLVGVGVLSAPGVWRTFFVPLPQRFARWGWPPI